MAVERNDAQTHSAFLGLIDGKPCEAANGGWIESRDPARGEVWALIPDGGAEDVDRAVDAARRAFGRKAVWRRLSAAERAARLRRLGDLVLRDAGATFGRHGLSAIVGDARRSFVEWVPIWKFRFVFWRDVFQRLRASWFLGLWASRRRPFFVG